MVHIQRGYLGRRGGVRLVEEGPDLGLEPLPPGERARVVGLLVAEHARHLLVAGPLRVDVQLVQDGERGLEGKSSYEGPEGRKRDSVEILYVRRLSGRLGRDGNVVIYTKVYRLRPLGARRFLYVCIGKFRQ